MNQISPKSLLHSKWTKICVENKEKHFVITQVEFNEKQVIEQCIIQAVMTHNEYQVNWRSLKDSKQWKIGWQ